MRRVSQYEPGFRVDNPLTRAEEGGDPDEIEEAREWLESHPRTITAWYDSILVDPKTLLNIPGSNGEEFRIDYDRVYDLSDRMRESGFIEGKRPLIVVDADGFVSVFEGNHRIRAAVAAGLTKIPITVRYYGGSERIPGVFHPVVKNDKDTVIDHEADIRTEVPVTLYTIDEYVGDVKKSIASFLEL